MKTSSCKAKGSRLAKQVRDWILQKYPSLHESDVIVTPSGVTGPDVLLSHAARTVFPYAIETKNQEKLNIWEALAQAEAHSEREECVGLKPVLFFGRNRSEIYAVFRMKDL